LYKELPTAKATKNARHTIARLSARHSQQQGTGSIQKVLLKDSVIAGELEGNRRDCNTIEKQRGRR
jgi:hypothetical protein